MALAHSRIVEIENLTQEMLSNTYGKEEVTPPIDIGAVLEKQGLKLKTGKFHDVSVSGAYDRGENTIFVSERESYKRQSFTVAHELGHHILHAAREKEVFYRHQALQLDIQDQPEEQEANWFAASILMPRDIVRRFWNVTKDIDNLASLFGVSSQAMYWRVKNLGGLIEEEE